MGELARPFCVILSLLLLPPQSMAQAPPAPTPPGDQVPQRGIEQIRPAYVLGPNDQILIRAVEVEEIGDKPFRIEEDGTINLPVVGRVRAGGLTVQQFETELVNRLRTYVKNPLVTVNIVQFRSEPVFFVGAFKTPGIYPLQGRRTLVEMLTAVGGLQPNASRRIKLTRRSEFGKIPLPNAQADREGKASTVEISMGSLRENVNPAEDVVLQPFDVISVERAEMVYITGEVGKVGAFELGERDSMSVIQVLTLAGGLTPEAAPKKARILRPILNTSRRAEIPIDLRRVLEGKANDFPLLPNDVLVIPRNGRRVFWSRAVVYLVPVAGALATTLIYVAVR